MTDLFAKRSSVKWRLISGIRGRAEMPTLARPNSFQADTLFFPIRGRNRAIFVTVELTSRWAYARLYRGAAPTAAESARFLADLASVHQIEYLTTDPGSEYTGRAVRDWAKRSLVVLHYADTADVRSKGVVEALNRTLRLLLTRYAEFVDPAIDQAALDNVVNQYNRHKHSLTRVAPVEASADDLARIRLQAAERGDDYRTLLARFPAGTKVRVWLGQNPEWSPVERAAWVTYHKTGLRWTRRVYTVAGQEGYKLLLHGQDGRWSPRDLLLLSAPEHVDYDADVEAETALRRQRVARRLRREELDEAAADADAGIEPATVPARARRPIARLSPDSPARNRKPRATPPAKPRARARQPAQTRINVLDHRGVGPSFRILVSVNDRREPAWRPLSAFIRDGVLDDDVYSYLQQRRLVRRSGAPAPAI